MDMKELNKEQGKILEAEIIVVEDTMNHVSEKVKEYHEHDDTVSNLYESMRQKFGLTASLGEFSQFIDEIYLHNDKTYEFIKLINAKLITVVTDSSVSKMTAGLQEIIANLTQGMIERSRNIGEETDSKFGNFNVVALNQFAATIEKYYKILKIIHNDYAKPELDYRFAMFGKEQESNETTSLTPDEFKNLISQLKSDDEQSEEDIDE